MKYIARLVRLLTGREVTPREVKRVRLFEDDHAIQMRVDVEQRAPVDHIELRLVI